MKRKKGRTGEQKRSSIKGGEGRGRIEGVWGVDEEENE